MINCIILRSLSSTYTVKKLSNLEDFANLGFSSKFGNFCQIPKIFTAKLVKFGKKNAKFGIIAKIGYYLPDLAYFSQFCQQLEYLLEKIHNLRQIWQVLWWRFSKCCKEMPKFGKFCSQDFQNSVKIVNSITIFVVNILKIWQNTPLLK